MENDKSDNEMSAAVNDIDSISSSITHVALHLHHQQRHEPDVALRTIFGVPSYIGTAVRHLLTV